MIQQKSNTLNTPTHSLPLKGEGCGELVRMRVTRSWVEVIIILSCLIFLTSPANAVPYKYNYGPDHCQFTLELPGEPLTLRRCHPDLSDKCDLRTTYTQVFGLDTTLNVYVKCTAIEEETYQNYTPDLLRTTLIAQAGSRVASYRTDDAEFDTHKMAMLLGTGTGSPNNKDMLYSSQIRVADKSILLIEGEILGAADKDADRMLANILHSIRLKEEQAAE